MGHQFGSTQKIRDLGQVRRPVVDARVEDRTKDRVLTHVRVERVDQSQDALMPAKPFVECARHESAFPAGNTQGLSCVSKPRRG